MIIALTRSELAKLLSPLAEMHGGTVADVFLPDDGDNNPEKFIEVFINTGTAEISPKDVA